MEPIKLEYLKKLLLQEKQRHQSVETEMEAEELSVVDNHLADAGTELMMVTTDLAIEDFKEDEMEKIDAALQAIEDGIYGKCRVCEQGIPYERLEAVPTALTCLEHAEIEA